MFVGLVSPQLLHVSTRNHTLAREVSRHTVPFARSPHLGLRVGVKTREKTMAS
jgi:hypothetical protein